MITCTQRNFPCPYLLSVSVAPATTLMIFSLMLVLVILSLAVVCLSFFLYRPVPSEMMVWMGVAFPQSSRDSWIATPHGLFVNIPPSYKEMCMDNELTVSVYFQHLETSLMALTCIIIMTFYIMHTKIKISVRESVLERDSHGVTLTLDLVSTSSKHPPPL